MSMLEKFILGKILNSEDTKANKMLRFLRHCIILVLIILNNTTSVCQLQIDTTKTVNHLVNNVLTGRNNNLKISNISYYGEKQSIAEFILDMEYNRFPKHGIILSTGDVFNAKSSNILGNASAVTSFYGDEQLTEIAGGETFDLASLEFDFISYTDSISFSFFFASEEYPEYVNKNVNDVFAFFLINDSLKIEKNLAKLNFTKTPISVDQINQFKNSASFLPSVNWNRENMDKYKETDKALLERSAFLQFDGMTTNIDVGSMVIPLVKYHMKIAIADVGDRYYDSAIFLEANSFKSIGENANQEKWEQLTDNEIVNSSESDDSTLKINLNIQFEFNSHEIIGSESMDYLHNIAKILNSEDNITVQIYGHTDTVGEENFNLDLSKKRAESVSEFLIGNGVNANQIEFFGLGESKPISETSQELNRRVELIFKEIKTKK